MRNQFTQEYTTAGGMTFWLNPDTRCPALTGIELGSSSTYKNVFFGAEREYADNEGWTGIRRQVKKNKNSSK